MSELKKTSPSFEPTPESKLTVLQKVRERWRARREGPNGRLLPVMCVTFVDFIGLTSIAPLLPFFAKRFDANPVTIGFLFAAYSIFQMIGGPVLGKLSDRHGRKKLLMLSQFGSVVSYLLMANADTIWLVFFARALDGLTGGNSTLAYAYAADVTTRETRTNAFGKIAMAYGIGQAVGPFISGLLVILDIRYPLYAAAGFSLVSMLITYVMMEDKTKPLAVVADAPTPHTARSVLSRAETRLMFAKFFMFQIAFSIYFLGLGMFCERRFTNDGFQFSTREAGWVYGFGGALTVLTQLFVLPRLTKIFPERKLIPLALATTAVGYVMLAATSHLAFLLLIIPLVQLGNGVSRPALWGLLSRTVDKSAQGLALGMNQTQISLANMLGPIISGLILQNVSVAYWSLFPFALVALNLFLRLPKVAGDTT